MTAIDPKENAAKRGVLGERNSKLKTKKELQGPPKGVLLLGILAVALIFGASCVYLAQNKTDQVSLSKETTSTPAPSYQEFLGVWNDKVRAFELEDAHLLPSTDHKKLIDILKVYIDIYTHSVDPKINQSLETISREYPGCIWRHYYDFISSHSGKPLMTEQDWKSANSSYDLRKILSKATGNTDYDESIKIILASSDPCAFFEIYKYDLWNKKGLSRNFKKCSPEIIDAAKFPELAALIRNY